jgi:hypothetical protein
MRRGITERRVVERMFDERQKSVCGLPVFVTEDVLYHSLSSFLLTGPDAT